MFVLLTLYTDICFQISTSVKKTNVYISLFLSFTVLLACQNARSENDTQIESSSDITNSTSATLRNYSPIFQAILKNDQGMARGVSIGDTLSLIKETTLPSETQPDNGLGYTEYFDNTDLNFADILYVRGNDDLVAEISIDIYIEKQSTVDSLFAEFQQYFEQKYGKGTPENKSVIWKLPDGKNMLILQNVSTKKDPGLKIVFSNLKKVIS